MNVFRPLNMDELFAMIYGSLGCVDIYSLTGTPKPEGFDPSRDEFAE